MFGRFEGLINFDIQGYNQVESVATPDIPHICFLISLIQLEREEARTSKLSSTTWQLGIQDQILTTNFAMAVK